MSEMTKAEMASYLVSLHNLIEAQMKSPKSTVNQGLAWEYERMWDALTAQIKEEREHETRKREQVGTRRPETGANQLSSGPGGGEPTRGPYGSEGTTTGGSRG